jgi:hypothetical protein
MGFGSLEVVLICILLEITSETKTTYLMGDFVSHGDIPGNLV